MKNFGTCLLTVVCCNHFKAFAQKKKFQQPLKMFFTYVKILNFTLYYYYILLYKIIYFTQFTITVLLRYSQCQYTRIMHNTERKKQNIFKQPCHFFSTNSELLPASACKPSILAVVRRSTLTSSSAIFRRLKARDCFFLGAICGREQEECYYSNRL